MTSGPLRGTELKRFQREERRSWSNRRRIVLVAEHIAYPVNVGSLLRIADAIDAEVVLCGTSADPHAPSAAKVARGKQQRVRWRRADDAAEALASMKADGIRTVAVEIAPEAVRYDRYQWPVAVALVLGNEDHGVTRATLSACDDCVYVPMLGSGRSLNVHVAAAVVAYRALLAPMPSNPST